MQESPICVRECDYWLFICAQIRLSHTDRPLPLSHDQGGVIGGAREADFAREAMIDYCY